MQPLGLSDRTSRRSFMKAISTGVIGLCTAGKGAAARSQPDTVLRKGTTQATPIFQNSGRESGQTALIIGGVHGNERAGYLAAEQLARWTPPRGKTVVVPRANAVAVANETREANGDLNRQFPVGKRPTTPLARALWRLIERTQPDVLLDLHESTGRYIDGKLGQSIAYPPFDGVRSGVNQVVSRLNRSIDRAENRFHARELPRPGTDPSGVLVKRAAFEGRVPAYLIETYTELELSERVRYHKTLTKGVIQNLSSRDEHHSGSPSTNGWSPYDTRRTSELFDQLP